MQVRLSGQPRIDYRHVQEVAEQVLVLRAVHQSFPNTVEGLHRKVSTLYPYMAVQNELLPGEGL